MQLNYGDMSDI